jgi:hypothetical protein
MTVIRCFLAFWVRGDLEVLEHVRVDFRDVLMGHPRASMIGWRQQLDIPKNKNINTVKDIQTMTDANRYWKKS